MHTKEGKRDGRIRREDAERHCSGAAGEISRCMANIHLVLVFLCRDSESAESEIGGCVTSGALGVHLYFFSLDWNKAIVW